MATGITEVNLTYHNSFTENDQNTVDFVHQILLMNWKTMAIINHNFPFYKFSYISFPTIERNIFNYML